VSQPSWSSFAITRTSSGPIAACTRQTSNFFQTIVANSCFASSAINVEDHGSATNQLAPLHQIGPARDRFFGNAEADFQLAASTKKFFIRKVSTARSAQLLDRIDRELLGVAGLAPPVSRS
jgi:hypothetical protein